MQTGAVVWGLTGFVVAVSALPGAGAAVVVGAASLLFPACAVLAAVVLGHGRARAAGGLLILSAATPTYFAWVLGVPALLVGLMLVMKPGLVGDESGAAA